jgi:hypothetical protein
MSDRTQHSITCQVTQQLAEALTQTAAMQSDFDDNRRSPKLANDAENLARVADQLEVLTTAVLFAYNAVSLRDEVTGARFSVWPNGQLNKHLYECVGFLRNDARRALAGYLDQWNDANTRAALAMLSGLYGMVVGEVVRNAEADLQTIRDAGVAGFLNIAGQLSAEANLASPDGRKDVHDSLLEF